MNGTIYLHWLNKAFTLKLPEVYPDLQADEQQIYCNDNKDRNHSPGLNKKNTLDTL